MNIYVNSILIIFIILFIFSLSKYKCGCIEKFNNKLSNNDNSQHYAFYDTTLHNLNSDYTYNVEGDVTKDYTNTKEWHKIVKSKNSYIDMLAGRFDSGKYDTKVKDVFTNNAFPNNPTQKNSIPNRWDEPKDCMKDFKNKTVCAN